jgi:hypothetical protein
MSKLIFNRLKSWFSPPLFDNTELNRQAQLLNLVIWASIVIALLRLSAPVDNRVANLALILIFVLALLASLRFMHQGRIRLASHGLVASLWVIITLGNLFFGGVRGPAYSAYTMLITIAGLLLGGRSAIYYALLCTLAGSTLLLLENQGLTRNARTFPSLYFHSRTTPPAVPPASTRCIATGETKLPCPASSRRSLRCLAEEL